MKSMLTQARGVVFLGLSLLLASGCSTTNPGHSDTLRLDASGSPGVEFRLIATRNGKGVQDQVYTVPAEISLSGRNLDVVCFQGNKAGTLSIRATRNGRVFSAGQTGEPGAVTEFRVRGQNIDAITKSARAAASGKSP